MSGTETTIADKQELAELVLNYARGCDTQDPEIFKAIFAEDGVIESPQATMVGRDQIVDVVPRMLGEMYLRCMHFVGNMLFDVKGDTATGEVYCLAHHLTRESDSQASDFIMSIKYADAFRRVDGRWLIARRRLNLGWTETRTVQI
ncbi:nuclear transport factor 2 family protein [Flavisphingomonas formosensis]|uniref:nuclear transport factor 2 family protein n=1 Tax=Flavisphingomonas formosensis TaxID=861534 RepID=UPI0012FAF6DF|nr:nuclear transport factor 2 family protein [Sphingomonas formosensis]